MQSGVIDIRRLGSHAGFTAVRNLYNSQDRVTKVLGRRLVDGGTQKHRARKSLAYEEGCQIQYQVEWADTVVLKEHLPILEANGYKAQSARCFTQFGMGPAACLVEVSWQPTWEPEARLCNHAPHFEMIQEYNLEKVECSPIRLRARNIDDDQTARLQMQVQSPAMHMTRPSRPICTSVLTRSTLTSTFVRPALQQFNANAYLTAMQKSSQREANRNHSGH